MRRYRKLLKCFGNLSIGESIYFIARVFSYWQNNSLLNINPEDIEIKNMNQVIEVLKYFSFTKFLNNTCFTEFNNLKEKEKLRFIVYSFKLISKNRIYKRVIALQKINETLTFKDAYKKIKRIYKKLY